MLSHLTIQNFALIDDLSLDFHSQLNILTGETGAGKSIVIDALRIAMGERMSVSELRDPKRPCVIEAVFELKDPQLRKLEAFDDLVSKDDTQLIVQRTYDPEGRQKIKINGQSITVSQLKMMGDHLMDFHGPHDHQMILASSNHRGLLDRLVSLEEALPSYREIYKKYLEAKQKLEELQQHGKTREREVDLLSHQIKELEQVPLSEEAYDDLSQKKVKLNNAEKLFEYANQLLGILEGEDDGLSDRLRKLFVLMRSLNQTDEHTLPWMANLEQIQEHTSELTIHLRDYVDGLSFEPDEASKINDAFDVYEDIKRKYGSSLEDAQRFYVEAKSKYDLLSHFEQNDADLREAIENLEKELFLSANKITKKRQKAALDLKKTIEKELAELGITHVQFEARVEKDAFGESGQDKVTFYISPNLGEDLKPLSEIVSSGEAARVMLGLKKALIDVDPIPVLIFDEIDAQIGGRLGTITGQKLREISKNRQVLLITHLPQIASFADSHFKVVKSVKGGRTFTDVKLLNKDDRVNELAKMMSGEKETKIALKHAEDLLVQARQ